MAAVRRIVSQLPNVSSAKTMVIRHEDGGEDFDLELRLSGTPDAGVDPRAMLRGVLRRSEMPRNIRLELADVTNAYTYK